MPKPFVHLRIHSEYSLVDGLLAIDPLIKAIVHRNMNALALTDFCNLFAAVKIYKAALEAGVKPILGADLLCHFADIPEQVSSLVLLCQNDKGYKNLTRLISKAYQEGQQQNGPRLHYEWLHDHSEGLIALSGGRGGAIGRAVLAGDKLRTKSLLEFFSERFPERFYLEIQRTGRPDETPYNDEMIHLSQSLNLPLVATNDVCFLNKEDFDAHEARVCIHQGHTLAAVLRPKIYSKEQYLRSAEEMEALFRDLPEALENSVIIAERCTVKLDLGNNYLPNFAIPDKSDVAEYLSQLAQKGLDTRLAIIAKEDVIRRLPYDERLQLELSVINNMGFAGYFLIVADFIRWAKENGVAVGPGRGSGAGSLVAYALGITDLDPLQYDLLFERFLNPERVSMPDFDIDFCMEGRDRVIEYVAEKYGRHSVSQIITFGTMTAKAVIRDVGRVLGHPYGFVDTIAKLIPFELGITLTKALEEEETLAKRYQEEEEVKELLDLALKLEGITRNAGKHAGGVVIAPSELTNFTAIYCEQGSTQIVSQFDKDDVEAVGLVKFDFLGLRTLTIIDWALANIAMDIDISRIPMNDAKTFALLKDGQTTSVFQLESRGMKELIYRLQPDCFEDIIALVALFRPGPLQSGMVDDFIDRKHGRASVAYPHPDLEPILKPTYGVILYQEQVMQIAQVLAGYTLGAADLLRRAMGKKKAEEMAQQRIIFTEGAVAQGVAETVATYIFDLMEKFAGYGFNKSHSAAYALIAYQTAWLKAHFPAAFMAAVVSSDMDNTDKVVIFINECREMKLQILPPSINHSKYAFTVIEDNKALRFGLGALKGVGESAINCILAEREKNGSFADLFDFCKRLDLRKVNKRVLEALIRSGAMDEWQIERATLWAAIDKAQQMAEKAQKNEQSGQADLFGLFDEEETSANYVPCKPWSSLERLDWEKKTLGFYMSGHPVSQYQQELKDHVSSIGGLQRASSKKAWVVALVASLRYITTKTGKKLLIMGLEDAHHKIEAVVFSEIYKDREVLLQVGQIVVMEGEISLDNFNGGIKMTAKQLLSIEEARSHLAKCLFIEVNAEQKTMIPQLKSLLSTHQGNCLVQMHYSNDKAKVALSLPEPWRVLPTDGLLVLLREILGADKVGFLF